VEATGQKNVVLTVYELLEGEATMSQGMDMASVFSEIVADIF
jgi:hypothetical protein